MPDCIKTCSGIYAGIYAKLDTDLTRNNLLTSYGSATIIYDNSGNSTSYLGDTLTWTGNQLTQQVHGQSTISYSYNESGLRTKKSISGGTETTYIWKDGILCAMKIGTTVLEFSYSATGDVVSVLYRPSSGSSVRYYYARNAQGDIIGLVNSSGTMTIRYTYDSRGSRAQSVLWTNQTSSMTNEQRSNATDREQNDYCELRDSSYLLPARQR